MKKLPDTEFEIMKAVWQSGPPVTAGVVMEALGDGGKAWKPQTLHTLLGRLVERGFLQTEKHGRERFYTPLVGRDEYLQWETRSFVEQYHGNSLLSFVNSFCQGKALSDEDAAALEAWLGGRGTGA